MTDEAATRREVDILRDQVNRMDSSGTRGVTALQLQMTDLVKDITELRSSVDKRFEKHEKEHVLEKRDRTSARHWAIATSLTVLVAMCTVIGLLLEILARVHK